MKLPKKFLLLGSGELGKEFTISAKRLANYVVAVDSYAGAHAMQVADEYEVINMLDSEALEKIVLKYRMNNTRFFFTFLLIFCALNCLRCLKQ